MLKDSQEREIQQKMLWERAKEMKYRCDLYRQIWNGLYNPNPETHECFKYQCFQREVIELKSLLNRNVEWKALTWEIFGDFERLYESFLVSEREYARQNIIHTKSFICVRILKYKSWRKKARVIYETSSLKCESWKKDERERSKLKLRRENRAANRSSEF